MTIQEPQVLTEAPALSSTPMYRDVLLGVLRDKRLWLLCGAFLTVGVLSLNTLMLYTPDSPRYLIWARSLASLKGFIDATSADPTRYVVHAPFYAVVLAPLAWFFSNIIVPAKIMTMVFGIGLIILFSVWLSPVAGRTQALIGAAFLALNPLVILFSSHVLSDIPFAVCVVLAFLLVHRLERDRRQPAEEWVLVAVVTAGIFMREVGLTLLFAIVVYFLLRRERGRALLLFTIPMLLYLVWHFRNEVFVAGIENPPLRNTRLFLQNAFTTEDAGVLAEFSARMRINVAVYADMAKGLLLYPQFLVRMFPVVDPTEPVLSSVSSVLKIAQYPLVLVQYGLAAWGVVASRRRHVSLLLFGLFSGFYLLLVLLYPINDIRFLLPVLVIVLYFAVLGAVDLFQRFPEARAKGPVRNVGVSLAFLILALPNAVWLTQMIGNNLSYRSVGGDLPFSLASKPKTPDLYVRQAERAARWIAGNSDPSAVVLSRWKELVFWLDGRKLVDTDPLLSLSLFEGMLRDYKVTHIVAIVQEPGVREFEIQMEQSTRFDFEPVYRAGNMEVIHVRTRVRDVFLTPVTVRRDTDAEEREFLTRVGAHGAELSVRPMFRRGIRLLESGSYDDAAELFRLLAGVTRGAGEIVLCRGIALAFAGRFDSADRLFDQFRLQPQAGPFIRHAWYHQQLIAHQRRALEDTTRRVRTKLYHMVSANYWDLGFRRKAFDMLERVFESDTAFAPALVFALYYELQRGYVEPARAHFDRLRATEPKHLMITPLTNIFTHIDSLKGAETPDDRSRHRIDLAAGFLSIGLRELAIEQLQAVLEEDSTNLPALKRLVDLYSVKRRRAAVENVLERIVAIEPENLAARSRLDSLQARYR